MSQNNFVVQDVVAHIHDEEDYQFKRSTGHIFKNNQKPLDVRIHPGAFARRWIFRGLLG